MKKNLRSMRRYMIAALVTAAACLAVGCAEKAVSVEIPFADQGELFQKKYQSMKTSYVKALQECETQYCIADGSGLRCRWRLYLRGLSDPYGGR